VLRFAAIFSRYPAAINWACEQAAAAWGPVLRQTADIDFGETDYYRDSMGDGLKKRLVAFAATIDPAQLVESKLQANAWEATYLEQFGRHESRPLNIDPGYITEAKVVLATMKDRDHRLYLGSGVFGEVTLYYQLPGDWVASRWTYPDYRRADYHEFFHACREELRRQLRQAAGQGGAAIE
jgi:hypothetical protein